MIKLQNFLPVLILLGVLITIGTMTTEDLLASQQSGYEDYSDSIGLQFGGWLRETQLDMETIYARASAIACAEGFYRKGSLAQRNLNPTNLKKAGYPRDRYRHSIFPTITQGWLETYKLLYKHRNESIDQIGIWWATDPNWSRNVRNCWRRMEATTGV